LAGLALSLPGEGAASPQISVPQSDSDLDKKLRANIHTVVVIYAENRSFNNLFADFPGVASPLKDVPAEKLLQRDRNGEVMDRLPAAWGGLVPDDQVVDHRAFKIGEKDLPPLPNAPFALSTPQGDRLPHGVVTNDLCHLFYHNQMQINGGRNDQFASWSDVGGMVMGHYADSAVNLRLWRIARDYTLCDNFFMGAFGGSFLNHQYLVAARPPYYPHADQTMSSVLIAEVEGGDPKGTRLKPRPNSPASALDGPPKFGPAQLSPDFYAVNTMGPPFAPAMAVDSARPAYADPSNPMTLPAQNHATIGDRLSDKGVDWAWYSGGWGAALAGKGAVQTVAKGDAEYSIRPNFQVHHQPLNYFARFAPGTAERAHHLRDGGLDDSVRTNHFLAAAQAGTLPAVTYYKPQGDLNMHAGYSDVSAGDRHIAHAIDLLQKGPQWENMLIVVTFDENGGWWDHVAPPKGDRWGPGSRIPALVVSPFSRKGEVDHTFYDTGSIARFIVRRFGLETLPGLTEREEATRAHGGPAPGDLTGALTFA
jgi:acid phosphatase